MAIGRSVDIAINHDPDAIAMHRANHPNTKHYCEDVWQVAPRCIMLENVPEIQTWGAHHAEVCAFLVKYFSNGAAKSVTDPLDTITTKDRFALITVNGGDYVITDIGMRMLQPHELFKAQGFPDDYIIDRDADGKPYPKTKQVARCGNAVTPQVPAALVRANLPEYCEGGSLYDPNL